MHSTDLAVHPLRANLEHISRNRVIWNSHLKLLGSDGDLDLRPRSDSLWDDDAHGASHNERHLRHLNCVCLGHEHNCRIGVNIPLGTHDRLGSCLRDDSDSRGTSCCPSRDGHWYHGHWSLGISRDNPSTTHGDWSYNNGRCSRGSFCSRSLSFCFSRCGLRCFGLGLGFSSGFSLSLDLSLGLSLRLLVASLRHGTPGSNPDSSSHHTPSKHSIVPAVPAILPTLNAVLSHAAEDHREN
mmetsp:Transcript_7756/g.15163  ORF Transcript_7756/g.15163 Transcript_7756/m.15163 type:complete len:240 (-) Transcript_7756:5-724(-)